MLYDKRVVPLAGTWIETGEADRRHLKVIVVPLAGTWIETAMCCFAIDFLRVVPLAGTWIETRKVARLLRF